MSWIAQWQKSLFPVLSNGAKHEEMSLLVCCREWSKQNLLANSAIYHASAPAIKLGPYILVNRMHLDLVVSNLVPVNSHYTVYSRMKFHEPCSPGWLNISYFSVSSSLAAWLSQFCFGYGNMQIMFSQYLSQINGLCWHWDGSSIADVLLLLYKVFGFFFIMHSTAYQHVLIYRTESNTSVEVGAFWSSIFSWVSNVRNWV